MFLERADENGNRLIRQTDGRLGATINDPDIYRVDPNDGTIAFYNPDTGRPFTGDNPRAQAKAWVESYNEELRETFNRVAEKHKAELEKSMAPAIEMLKFTPKYEKLDDVRRTMLDALIEGYEVYDEGGNHIGYSTDLDKALARVNKQVEAMKSKRPAAAMDTQPTPPTGPAVDMPSSGSGNSGGGEVVDSLEKAMLLKQEAILNKQKKR